MTIPLDPIKKIRDRTAVDICRRVELSPQALGYLTPSLSPQGFLAMLESEALWADAVRFLAFALPAREGVWWAAMTGAAIPGAYAGEADPAFSAAETWVYQPTEPHRSACLVEAEAANFKTSGAYSALGAFWSEGSMAPPDMPEALPDPSLSPIAISASVLLAVAAGDPAKSERHFRDALLRGVDIGQGGDGRGNETSGQTGQPGGRP